MAGDWIKLEINTFDKPEVMAITVAIGFDDPDFTVGKLAKMWRWFDQHTTDGNAVGVTSALLDRYVGVTGFCDAMQSVGWLVISSGGITLPHFDFHNGKTAKQRAQGAKRAANHRVRDESNAASVTNALPREEKRREDIERDISPQKTTRSNQTQVPDDFVPDQSSTASVASAKTAGVDVDHERQMFVLHYQANGEYRSNWQAQFRKWMLQAQQRKADDAKRSNVAQMHGNRRTYEDFRREKVALFGRVDGEAAAKAAFEWQEKQYARAG